MYLRSIAPILTYFRAACLLDSLGLALQEDRHTVVSCLHAPDDAHTKFDACPPCFFAVYDGHNGHLAADIAKSKVCTCRVGSLRSLMR